MSQSQPSTTENTMTSEEHDQEIEEYIWNMMGKSGLLSELKAQIAQFVQSNGKTKEKFSVDASRAHPNILAMIYEYLSWVGMKNTCALLRSESPITFETGGNAVVSGGKLQIPQLCSLLARVGGVVGSKADTDEESLKTDENIHSNGLNASKTLPTSNFIVNLPSSPNTGLNNTYDLGEPSVPSPAAQKSMEPKPSSTSSLIAMTRPSNDAGNGPSKISSVTKGGNLSPLETSGNSKVVPGTVPNGSMQQTRLDFGKPLFDPFVAESTEKVGKLNDIKVQPKQSSLADLPEINLKPSNSDQSVQGKTKDQMPYVFMTEKQKMEALNKKFSGVELKPLKNLNDDVSKASSSEPSKSNFKQGGESPVNLTDIPNPWAKSNVVDVDFEEESISDLLDSTAEDCTQDLSMDSDSKALAANLNECDHHVKLK